VKESFLRVRQKVSRWIDREEVVVEEVEVVGAYLLNVI